MSPLVLGGIAVAVAILAIALANVLGGNGGTAGTHGAQSGGIGAEPAAAAAPGPPPGCSSAAITPPRHSRITVGEFDRRVWCARYHATPNSSIYQFVGVP
ncbi:MAG TPA: hypothetical protein VME22_21870 [Solirubrobacteraceae bacterium]|nr:hypothetical protein [Solirubrobacteraceae bacterium]